MMPAIQNMFKERNIMKKILFAVLVFIFIGCGPGSTSTVESELVFDDFYWQKLNNDNPNFIKIITIPITFYICGSPEALKGKFLQTHLEYADFHEDQIVIGYAHNEWPQKEIWIIGKTDNGNVYVPPIILAHEVLELLSRNDLDNEMVNPHDYGRIMP